MAAITKTITLTEINAIGASASGSVDFGSALPAGAIPLQLVVRRLQAVAVTSSGGTPTSLTFNLVVSGGATGIFASAKNLDVDAAAQRNFIDTGAYAAKAATVFPYESETTYAVLLTVAGSGVTMANIDGPTGNVLEATLVYYDPTA